MSYCVYVTETYLDRIGGLIRDARKHRGLTQIQLADVLGTSQSAVHRIEAGNQNVSVDMISRIAKALDAPIISVGAAGPTHLRVQGGTTLSGSIRMPTCARVAGTGTRYAGDSTNSSVMKPWAATIPRSV